MNRILILCDLFPPAFAPRMGYLCKYLQQLGWSPTVLTETVEDENAFSFLDGQCPVTRINYHTAQGKTGKKWQWLYVFVLDFCFDYKDRRMAKEADKLCRKHTFDILLCSSYRDFPLIAARKTACKHKIPLVIDLRDIIEQFTGHEYITHRLPAFWGLDKWLVAAFKWKSRSRRRRALAKADCITTVSPWHVEMLRPYNPRVELLYNGYDPELFYPEQKTTRQFIITYTGRLVSTAMRDPQLLTGALTILSGEGLINPGNCRVHWYIDEASETVLEEVFEKAGVLAYMDFKGYAPAHKIPAALNGSSLLLLLANKASGNGPKGIMTTKIFEYFAVEKPILCVRSDESYLAALLDETKAGIAATAVEEVCDFIRHYFRQWQEKGYTSVTVNREVTTAFSRRKQAEQFIRLFTQLIQARHG
ncbi:MAG: glycosyltransferase [Tannerellaceae bacterium]|jgi:glycosyltransferase involved in cell wall biosynthesis|nr:glycosyltransferase [Tannerellaceae bacterium]